MIKKVVAILLILLTCVSCGEKSDINYPYEIKSHDVDMSKYDGVNSTDHMFKRVTIDQLFNCVDLKSSGVFYLGRTNCGCCQTTVQYMNEAAKEANVYIYYIDVYDPDMPMVISGEDCAECKQRSDRIEEILYNFLDVNDEGEKVLQTPTVFTVINGEVTDCLICMNGLNWDSPPTENQINRLKNRYIEMFKPFSK